MQSHVCWMLLGTILGSGWYSKKACEQNSKSHNLWGETIILDIKLPISIECTVIRTSMNSMLPLRSNLSKYGDETIIQPSKGNDLLDLRDHFTLNL